MTNLGTAILHVAVDLAGLRTGLRSAHADAENTFGRMNRLAGGLAAILGGALVTGGVKALADGMTDLARRAEVAEHAARAYGNAVERFGQDTSQADALVKRLSERFGVNASVVQQAATTLLRAGGSLGDVERALTAAGASAVAATTDISKAFDNVSVAVATGRSELLESAGLVTNLGPLYADYARSVGKSAEALTDAERVQVAANALYHEARFEIEEVDASLSGLTAAQNRSAAANERIAQALGRAVKPAVLESTNLIGLLGSRFAELFERTDVASTMSATFTAVVRGLAPVINSVAETVMGWIESLVQFIRTNPAVLGHIAQFGDYVRGAGEVILGVKDQVLAGWQLIAGSVGAVLGGLSVAIERFVAGVGQSLSYLGTAIDRALHLDFSGFEKSIALSREAIVRGVQEAANGIAVIPEQLGRNLDQAAAIQNRGLASINQGLARFREAGSKAVSVGTELLATSERLGTGMERTRSVTNAAASSMANMASTFDRGAGAASTFGGSAVQAGRGLATLARNVEALLPQARKLVAAMDVPVGSRAYLQASEAIERFAQSNTAASRALEVARLEQNASARTLEEHSRRVTDARERVSRLADAFREQLRDGRVTREEVERYSRALTVLETEVRKLGVSLDTTAARGLVAQGVALEAANQRAANYRAELEKLRASVESLSDAELKAAYARSAMAMDLNKLTLIADELIKRNEAAAAETARLAQTQQSARYGDGVLATLGLIEQAAGPFKSVQDALDKLYEAGVYVTSSMLTTLSERFKETSESANELAADLQEVATSTVSTSDRLALIERGVSQAREAFEAGVYGIGEFRQVLENAVRSLESQREAFEESSEASLEYEIHLARLNANLRDLDMVPEVDFGEVALGARDAIALIETEVSDARDAFEAGVYGVGEYALAIENALGSLENIRLVQQEAGENTLLYDTAIARLTSTLAVLTQTSGELQVETESTSEAIARIEARVQGAREAFEVGVFSFQVYADTLEDARSALVKHLETERSLGHETLALEVQIARLDGSLAELAETTAGFDLGSLEEGFVDVSQAVGLLEKEMNLAQAAYASGVYDLDTYRLVLENARTSLENLALEEAELGHSTLELEVKLAELSRTLEELDTTTSGFDVSELGDDMVDMAGAISDADSAWRRYKAAFDVGVIDLATFALAVSNTISSLEQQAQTLEASGEDVLDLQTKIASLRFELGKLQEQGQVSNLSPLIEEAKTVQEVVTKAERAVREAREAFDAGVYTHRELVEVITSERQGLEGQLKVFEAMGQDTLSLRVKIALLTRELGTLNNVAAQTELPKELSPSERLGEITQDLAKYREALELGIVRQDAYAAKLGTAVRQLEAERDALRAAGVEAIEFEIAITKLGNELQGLEVEPVDPLLELAERFSKAGAELQKAESLILQSAGHLVGGMASVLQGMLASSSQEVAEGIGQLIDGLAGALQGSEEPVLAAAKSLASGLKGVLGSLARGDWVGAIVGGVASAIDAVVSLFTAAERRAAQAAKRMADSLESYVGTLRALDDLEAERQSRLGQNDFGLGRDLAHLNEQHQQAVNELQGRYRGNLDEDLLTGKRREAKTGEEADFLRNLAALEDQWRAEAGLAWEAHFARVRDKRVQSAEEAAGRELTLLERLHSRGVISATEYETARTKIEAAHLKERFEAQKAYLESLLEQGVIAQDEFAALLAGGEAEAALSRDDLLQESAERLRAAYTSLLSDIGTPISQALEGAFNTAAGSLDLKAFGQALKDSLRRTLIQAVSEAALAAVVQGGVLAPLLDSFKGALGRGDFSAARLLIPQIQTAADQAAELLAPIIEPLGKALTQQVPVMNQALEENTRATRENTDTIDKMAVTSTTYISNITPGLHLAGTPDPFQTPV